MYLKRVELTGFKSFARKTALEFPSALSGIVGPNGSGKSNICDGIRWVLGEQSTKTLRSEKMDDCIFVGTEHAKPADSAEVTLVFNNESKIFPIEGDLAITRRLDRKTGSDYLINGETSKLKDIRMMMMDTGLSKDAYAIIGQGMIEQIVAGSGMDRRLFIEEAAGVVRYKHQRNETMKKLKETEKNMETLRSVLIELDRSRQPLAMQAQYAKRFLKLKEELNEKEVALLFHDRASILKEEKAAAGSIEELKRREEEAKAKIAQFQAEIAELDLKIAADDEALAKLNADNKADLDELEKQRDIRQRVIEAVSAKRADIDKRTFTITEGAAAREKAVAEIEAIAGDLSAAEARRAGLEAKIRVIEDEITKIARIVTSSENSVIEGKDSTIDTLNELARHKNAIAHIRSEREILEERSRRKKVDLETAKRDLAGASDRSLKDRMDDTTKRQRLKRLEAEVAERERELKEVREQEEYFRNKVQSTMVEITRLEAELKTKEKIAEGSGDIRHAVRALLEEKKRRNPALQGLCGMVAEIVNTSKELEVAIETALGAYLQAIVTETAEDSKAAVEFLKRGNLGRATFLPMDLVQGKGVRRVQPFSGLVGNALDLVTFDPRYRTIMEYLLGNVLVVRDMDTAISTARRGGFGGKLVTLEGETISGSGVVTGGSRENKSRSLLASGLDGLRMRLDSLVKSRAGDMEKLAMCSARLRQTENAGKNTLVEYEKLKENIHVTAKTTEDAATLAERLGREIKTLEEEIAAIAKDLVRLAEESGKSEAVVAELDRRVAERERLIREAQEGSKRERTKLERLASESSELKSEFSALCQKCGDLRERVDRRKKEIAQIDAKASDFEADLARENAALEKLLERDRETSVVFEKVLESVKRYQEAAGALENALKTSRQARDIKDRLLKSREKSVAEFVEKIYEMRNTLQGFALRREQVEERLRAEFSIPAEEIDKPREVEGNRDELISRITKLKYEIDLLGEVNLHSIKEYEQICERCAFYEDQIRDLETGRQSTLSIIHEIDAKCEVRLAKTLEEINSNIVEIFRILFGGGTVRLELERPEDLLNSPIDIVARPPGKKNQSIMLLSGGEKTLTALSLLFAILRVKPSPFCILDEVEAALDEANVRRFIELLKTFTDRTQFLLITHNKVTMQYLDILYGITQQEQGISKVISVKLEEAIRIAEQDRALMKKEPDGDEAAPRSKRRVTAA